MLGPGPTSKHLLPPVTSTLPLVSTEMVDEFHAFEDCPYTGRAERLCTARPLARTVAAEAALVARPVSPGRTRRASTVGART